MARTLHSCSKRILRVCAIAILGHFTRTYDKLKSSVILAKNGLNSNTIFVYLFIWELPMLSFVVCVTKQINLSIVEDFTIGFLPSIVPKDLNLLVCAR